MPAVHKTHHYVSVEDLPNTPAGEFDFGPTAPPPDTGGIGGDIERGFGQLVSSTARGVQTILPEGATDGVQKWGMDLAAAHPSQINGVGDILSHPVVAAREALGESAPQIAEIMAAGTAGRLIGTGIAGVAGAETGPGDAVIAPAGGELGAHIGSAAAVFGQQLGANLQTQNQHGEDNIWKAMAGAVPGTALALWMGPEAYAAKIAAKSVIQQSADGLLKTIGKETVKNAGIGVGLTALGRVGGGEDLTSPDALNDYGVSGFKGGVAGGVIGTVMHGITRKADTPSPTDTATADAPVADTTPVEPVDLLQLSDQRPPTPLRITDQRGPVDPSAPIAVNDEAQAELPATPTVNLSPVGTRALDEGQQGDLFRRPRAIDSAPPLDGIDLTGANTPPAPVTAAGQAATNFTPAGVVEHVRTMLADADGNLPKTDSFTLKVAKTVSDHLMSNDPAGLTKFFGDQGEELANNSKLNPAQIDKRSAVLHAAADAASDYARAVVKAKGLQDDAAAKVGPSPIEQLAAQPPPEPATPPLPPVGQPAAVPDIAAAPDPTKLPVNQMRASILKGVLDDPTTHNPTGRFITELRKAGFPDTGIAPHEANTIARFEDARHSFGQPIEHPRVSDAAFAAEPAQSDPGVSDTTLGIPERVAPPQTVSDRLKARQRDRVAQQPEAWWPGKNPVKVLDHLPGDLPPEIQAKMADAPHAADFEDGARAELAGVDNPGPDYRRNPNKAAAFRAGREAVLAMRDEHSPTETTHETNDASVHATESPARQGADAKGQANAEPHVQANAEAGQQEVKVRRPRLTLPEAQPAVEARAEPAADTAAPESNVPDAAHTAVQAGLTQAHVDGKIDNYSYKHLSNLLTGDMKPGEPRPPAARTQVLIDKAMAMMAKRTVGETKTATGAGRVKPDTIVRQVAKASDTTSVRTQAAEGLQRRLDRYGLHDVGLKLAKTLGGDAANYDAQHKLISIALLKGEDAVASLDHEAVHAMRDLDLITQQEVNVLGRKLQQDPVLVKWVKDNYPTVGTEGWREEVLAQGAAERIRANESLTGVKALVRKIANIGEALGNVLRGLGFKSADDVLKSITSGEVGARDRGVERAPSSYYSADPVAKAAMVEKAVEKLPEAVREPTRQATETILDWAHKAVALGAFTHDLVDMAVKAGLPSARTFLKLWGEKTAIEKTFKLGMEKILIDHHRLSGADRKAVNRLLGDSTLSGKWAFKPDFKDADGNALPWTSKVVVDPEMAAQFKGLTSEAARQNVIDIFRHSGDALRQKQAALIAATNSSYDALIAAAHKAGDAAEAKKLTDAKAGSISRFNTLMALNENAPYAPRKRFGDYVTVAKSADYLALEKRAMADESLKRDLAKMEGDRTHYIVDYSGTMGEAMGLGRQIAGDFAGGTVSSFERSDVKSHASGNELFMAFDQLRKMITSQLGEGSNAAQRQVTQMINDLYLSALSEKSARKSEINRRGVGMSAKSEETNMVRAFASQGGADASFLKNLHNNSGVLDALSAMRTEARDGPEETRKNRERLLKELLLRHAENGKYNASPIGNAIKGVTSLYTLALSPGYYVQNLMQPMLMSVPYMAGDHGYMNTWGKFRDAYMSLAPLMKDAKMGDPLILKGLAADAQRVVDELVTRGTLDITLSQDMGDLGAGDGFATQLLRGVKGLNNKVETINRVATAIAAYRAEMEAHGDHEAAANYAQHVVDVTHGTYDGFNAPRVFNNPTASVLLQFRKFQLIQVSFMARMVANSFGDGTPAQKVAARKALGFVLAHTAAMSGAIGLPGAQLAGYAISHLFGDKDKPKDIERMTREAIGDPHLADLILKGAPSLAGIDLTGKAGMGTMLSLLPFADTNITDRKGYNSLAVNALGPFFGGILPKAADGLGYLDQGDYYKAIERFIPNGVSNAMKAYRQANGGVTEKNGTVDIRPDEISTLDTVATALGFATTQTSDRAFVMDMKVQQEDMLKSRASRITRDYEKASQSKDPAGMEAARNDWRELQDTRRKTGFQAQPLSQLLRATQKIDHAKTAAGVSYNKGDQAYVKRTAALVDTEADGTDAEAANADADA